MAKGWTKVEPEQKTEPKAEAPAVAPVLLTMTQDQLLALISNLPANSPAAGITADDLKDILKSNREEQEARRSIRHSNADHLHISAFSHPAGDLKQPKPKLTRETYFNNHRETEEECTALEIECFNAFTTDCTARDGRWTAKIDQGGRRIRIDVPSFTMDELSDLPKSLPEILRELAEGPKAVTTLDMLARIADLERAVRESQASVVLAS